VRSKSLAPATLGVGGRSYSVLSDQGAIHGLLDCGRDEDAQVIMVGVGVAVGGRRL